MDPRKLIKLSAKGLDQNPDNYSNEIIKLCTTLTLTSMSEKSNSIKELETAIGIKQAAFEEANANGRPKDELSLIYKQLKDLQLELAFARINKTD
jgi:hypothetical protein